MGWLIEPETNPDYRADFRLRFDGPRNSGSNFIVFRGTYSECEALTLPVDGYCTQCGIVRPHHETSSSCIPCLNTGHSYRIVNSEADRLWRIMLWGTTYAEHGFTRKQVENLHSWKRLIDPPDGWDGKRTTLT